MKTASYLSLVGAVVKTYMTFGLLWSKADALYQSVKNRTGTVTVRTTLQTTAK